MAEDTPPTTAPADQAPPASTTSPEQPNFELEAAFQRIARLERGVTELFTRPVPAPVQPAQERQAPTKDPATYELFPAWLQAEIDAGSDIEAIKKLRKALTKAISESRGLLHKANENREQGYNYVGHEEVMAACRQIMAENGLSLDQPLCEREMQVMIPVGDKTKPRWMWRAVCLITHDEGGVLVRVVRPITLCNDKASFVARTAADRTVMMTAMRIAGARNEDPDHPNNNDADEPRGAPQAAQPQQPRDARPAQQRAQAPASSQRRDRAAPQISPEQHAQADKSLAELLAVLKPRTTAEQLIEWARIHNFDYALPQKQKQAAWAAFGAKCAAGKYDPNTLVEQANKLGPIDDGHDHITGEIEPPFGGAPSR